MYTDDEPQLNVERPGTNVRSLSPSDIRVNVTAAQCDHVFIYALIDQSLTERLAGSLKARHQTLVEKLLGTAKL